MPLHPEYTGSILERVEMTQNTAKPVQQNVQIVRETVESLAVAFILALMFKAFVAEAFVIPTGSMAPTLMGAHKDVSCEECGFQYQCGASSEYTESGERTGRTIYGTTCPLCRKPQILDLPKNSNHATFTGDRILVSKLAYIFFRPQRWQVFVFKHIEEAQKNYIKRCIGLPDESIRIQHGDIYIRNPGTTGDTLNDGYDIARKPPNVINAMLQPVADTQYKQESLVKAGVPDPWQPDPLSDKSDWSIGYNGKQWTAKVTNIPAGSAASIRYYHRVLDPVLWFKLEEDGGLPKPIPPTSSRLISDFTAYNAPITFQSSKQVPDKVPFEVSRYREEAKLDLKRAMQVGFFADNFTRPMENDGLHWTGDLAGEWVIKTEPNTSAIRINIVESGVEHISEIDLKTGNVVASLRLDGNEVDGFQQADGTFTKHAKASTAVRSGSKHTLRYSNVDDQIVLWVDGKAVTWDNGAKVNLIQVVPIEKRVPRSSPTNPLDAAPVAIGVVGGGCEITRARIFRDIYYIAHSLEMLSDYPKHQLITMLRESATAEVKASYLNTYHAINEKTYLRSSTPEALDRNALLSNPEAWGNSLMATKRRSVEFPMESDWYFPMGDNSSASHDARGWDQHHVPQRLLIGRAVMVFWPHYWNAPIPFLPNFKRMGLIR